METKYGKRLGTWESRAVFVGNKDPPGRPSIFYECALVRDEVIDLFSLESNTVTTNDVMIRSFLL